MRIKHWKEIATLMIGLAVGCLFAEAAIRIYFAWGIGPRVLLYGTEWYRNVDRPEQEKRFRLSDKELQVAAQEKARKDTVEVHGQDLGGYTKFFPNENKSTKDADTGERIPVAINAQGFRGKDFSQQKAPGVIRVLTLGASSTFGFYDRDDETYPYYLEKLLNERCGGNTRFEVINFAIPHARSHNIVAMFTAEGVKLSPDVVTFYEGRNDSTMTGNPEGVIGKLYAKLVNRLLLVAFIDQTIIGERVSLTDPSVKLEPLMNERSRFFLASLTALLDASRNAGSKFIVVSQQATSRSPLPGAKHERLNLRGVTYDQEAGEISRRMAAKKEVTTYEYSLLVHQRLMKDMKQWAEKQNVPFVDVIGALDQDRHYLLSWVHLHPEANRVIAAKLSEPILRQFCAAP
ncbi:MAG: SGNH/GDSL hydrolase family protein [Nitrosomonadales bacterium]|nr:SGNH/GDSL hydrolase family protein [Nitrosomonadales bacterium]